MWEYEHSVETTATAAALWRCWADVAGWPKWNGGVESIEIDGPFRAGTTFTMTPPASGMHSDPVTLRLTDVAPGERFIDEADGGDFKVTTVHRLEPAAGGRIRIVYRTEITGPAADQIGPELGPAITADFPEVLAALVRTVEGADG